MDREASLQVRQTSNEECISREDGPFVPVFHKPTDTILGVARRMQSFDIDFVANHKRLAMLWCCGYRLTVLASNHFQPLELG